jgi:hypothetical protein
MGLVLINYTGFKKSSIMLRLQLGLGFEGVQLTSTSLDEFYLGIFKMKSGTISILLIIKNKNYF